MINTAKPKKEWLSGYAVGLGSAIIGVIIGFVVR